MVGLLIRLFLFVLLFLFLKKVIEGVLLFLSINKKIQQAKRENLGNQDPFGPFTSRPSPKDKGKDVIEAEYKVLKK